MSSARAQKLPLVAVVVLLLRMRGDRHEDGLVAEFAAALQFVAGILDDECRDLGGRDQTRRVIHDRFLGPIVGHTQCLTQDFRGAERAGPHAERREDELGPDALFVEVLQAQFDVVGARCAVARGVELFLRNVGEPATERLSVDEDGLPLAVGILLGTGDEIGEMLGQACAPQIVGLEEVRITGIGPQLLVGHFGLHSFVRGWAGYRAGICAGTDLC